MSFKKKFGHPKMKQEDAPPLMFVVDDGYHVASHMAMSLFFGFLVSNQEEFQ